MREPGPFYPFLAARPSDSLGAAKLRCFDPMPNPTVIPNSLARRLLLQRQGLCEAPRRKLDAAGLERMIETMGFVQVDSIATVEATASGGVPCLTTSNNVPPSAFSITT